MDRKAALLLFFLMCLIHSYAQVGNEWINSNQLYYKIPVSKDGIYRLTYDHLRDAGFPVDAVDPSNIQLFHRGVEQAIYVEGEQDLKFDGSDFIEFYGRKNDGTLDAELYKPLSAQPHSYYNLFSDETSYFLTIGFTSGKRMESFFESSYTTPEPFHIDEKLLVLINQYAPGIGISSEIYTSSFDQGEGWTGPTISQNQFADYTFNAISKTVSSSGVPKLELLLTGLGPMQHRVEIYVGPSLRLLTTATFLAFNTYKVEEDLQWSDVNNNEVTVRVKAIGFGGTDRVSVSYLKLRYPQQVDLSNAAEKKLILQESNSSKLYLDIANASSAHRLFDITDPSNVIRIGTTFSSTLKAIVPYTTSSRSILATSQYTVVSTSLIKPVTFRTINPSEHNYIIITHPELRKPASGYADPVKAYGAYRASDSGGEYDTLIVNIQQLYDQFNYGEASPLAIFHFMKFLSTTKPPSYLFIIGKGLEVRYKAFRQDTLSWIYKDLVPTSGYPGSDMYYTVGLGNTTYEPAVPTGRLTAMTSQQVATYLNKVIEMEARPYDDLSRKNVLHLSGGIEEGEPQLFRNYLKGFEPTAEGHYLGGKVSSVAKQSRDLQVINISEQINKGVNLVTFFGHSNPLATDFEIGFATDAVMGYNNPGKYPVLLMNGCQVGAFFLYDFLFGEDWVFADKKGAIGFIAHTSYGVSSTLRNYTDYFYKVGYGDSTYITKGLGDIQKEAARRYMLATAPTIPNLAQITQMILLGDPAVRLFGAPTPDFEINNDHISVESFDGKSVTASTDSFALKLIVRNFGQAKPGLHRIEVTRTLNDQSTITYDSLFESTKYSDTLTFVIRKGNEKAFGNNSFKVTIDADNFIPELNEENNTATIDVPIPLDGTKNIFPYNFAIVNHKQVTLSLQATDVFSDEREFIIELDTLNTFDSPYKKQFTVKGKVLAKQVVELLDTDSLAYYWRTKFAQPQPNESLEWEVSSFTFIDKGSEGWAQVHFPQFLDDPTEGLVKDATLRKISFKETVTAVDIKTFGASAGKPRDSVSIKIAGSEYNIFRQGNGCRNNTINLIAFDRNSASPYVGLYFKWYEILFTYGGRRLICGREPFVINSFTPTELSTGNNDDVIQYVDNVALGDSVVLFNIGNAGYSAWPEDVKVKLGEFGISVTQINSLQSGEPVVIYGRKGLAPGSAKIYKTSGTPANESMLEVSATVTGKYSSGTIESGLIGPSCQWFSLTSKLSDVEAQDEVKFDVIGVKLDGQEEKLLEGVMANQDLTNISADIYPYLKLIFFTQDDLNLTPAQLKNWIVLYTPVPEGLLLYKGSAQQQTLAEGETWQTEFGFVNISERAFTDSLTVRQSLFNQGARNSHKKEFKIKAPAPGDTTMFAVNLATKNRVGLNDLSVFVNPKITPEQYYDNNVLLLKDYLRVVKDNANPVLDVTIDGRHVGNGDFVSPNPLIVVKLWDENPYILKTDTEGVRIFLTYPCEENDCTPMAINLSGDEVEWYAATAESEFRIEFRPKNLVDGKYTLQVEAQDGSGNKAGRLPYSVDFVVMNETVLKFFEPYPNPFSSDVNFTFVVSGNEPPEKSGMQVLDVNGKLVYELKNNAPGFYIGKNTMSWNGTDSNGNIASKGVYIYKLYLAIGDKHYQKVGKLVILR